jgi:hypothetical protein
MDRSAIRTFHLLGSNVFQINEFRASILLTIHVVRRRKLCFYSIILFKIKFIFKNRQNIAIINRLLATRNWPQWSIIKSSFKQLSQAFFAIDVSTFLNVSLLTLFHTSWTFSRSCMGLLTFFFCKNSYTSWVIIVWRGVKLTWARGAIHIVATFIFLLNFLMIMLRLLVLVSLLVRHSLKLVCNHGISLNNKILFSFDIFVYYQMINNFLFFLFFLKNYSLQFVTCNLFLNI